MTTSSEPRSPTDVLFQQVNPAKIDAYHAAIARELDVRDDGHQ